MGFEKREFVPEFYQLSCGGQTIEGESWPVIAWYSRLVERAQNLINSQLKFEQVQNRESMSELVVKCEGGLERSSTLILV